MVEKLEYKSTIKSMPYLYIETKKTASLIMQGFDELEIKNMSVKDNIFQMKTEARKKEVASMIFRRLNSLDEFLLNKLANGHPEISKHIIIYAIMKTDRLFFEFMNEVYKDKNLLKEKYIHDSDINIYFQRKCEQSDTVAAWKEYTLYKLKQVFVRILFEAGFIKNQKGDREITIPIVDPAFTQHLEAIGDDIYLKVMLG